MINAAVARYAAFFRLPDVTRLLAMAVLARMPLGTVTLALLLHVRELTGSFAAAGAAVGSYLAASALTAPIIGRWIDRRGARGALIVTGVVSPAALLVLWIAGPLGLSTPTVVGRVRSRRAPFRRRSPFSRARCGATASTTKRRAGPHSRSTLCWSSFRSRPDRR